MKREVRVARTPNRDKLIVCGLLCAASLFAANDGSGETWHVRKDGTGDYTVIQDAADVAADGDTILVGAGTYLEHAPFAVASRAEREVAVGIVQSDITLRGVHRDSVIITQVEYDAKNFGISMRYGAGTNLRIESLTVKNLREGITTSQWCEIRDVRATKCGTGFAVEGSALISECLLDSARNIGVFAPFVSQDVTIRDCVFRDNHTMALQMFGTPLGLIEDVEVSGGIVGLSIVAGANVVLRRCWVRDAENYCLDFGSGVQVELHDSIIEGSYGNIGFRGPQSFVGHGNLLRGSSYAALYRIREMDPMDFTGNEILLGDSLYATTEGIMIGVVDLANNWWGTTDPEFVRPRILDAQVDTLLGHEIFFEPMLQQKVSVPSGSVGGVKAQYKR